MVMLGVALVGLAVVSAVAGWRSRRTLGGRQRAAAWFALAGALSVSAAALAIVQPGQVHACGPLADAANACVVSTKIVEGPYGKYHQAIVEWKVTHAGKFELELTPVGTSQRDLAPALQVEDSLGLPMNVGLNFGLSSGESNDYKTKTKTLQPATYKLYVSSVEDGPDELVLAIRSLAPATASN